VAIGDPAFDLVMEWEFFTGESAAAFRRGRGWALWKALVNLGKEQEGGQETQAPAHDDLFGWRHSPRKMVGLLIADHARSAGR
jgi:hypothetical protein